MNLIELTERNFQILEFKYKIRDEWLHSPVVQIPYNRACLIAEIYEICACEICEFSKCCAL